MYIKMWCIRNIWHCQSLLGVILSFWVWLPVCVYMCLNDEISSLQFLHSHKLCWHFSISLNCYPCLCEHFVTAAVSLDTVLRWAEIGQDLNSLTLHQIFLFWIASARLEWQAILSYSRSVECWSGLNLVAKDDLSVVTILQQSWQETRRGLYHLLHTNGVHLLSVIDCLLISC